MKIKILSLALIILSSLTYSQCPIGDITLNSQADIDNFAINFPDCNSLDAGLIISGSTINNLSGISQITTVNGDLFIQNNSTLPSLLGLQIETVNGSIIIQNNDSLLNLEGLNAIQQVTTLEVLDNDLIQDLTGFGVFGLNGIISIQNNASLLSLNGLEDVEQLFNVSIVNNPSLTNVSAIEYIIFSGVGSGELVITGNTSLAVCGLTSFCNFISDGGTTTIMGNASGCNSVAEVQLTCPVCPPADLVLSSQADVDSFGTLYPNCSQLDFDLFVEGNDITNVNGLSQLVRSTERIYVRNNPNLVSLVGLENLRFVQQTLFIDNNDLLINLQGLGRFDFVRLDVRNNASMQTLEGLDFANSDNINAVSLRENNNLVDITNLENITEFPINFLLTISNNAMLSDCAIDPVCYLINENGGAGLTVLSNGPNCENYGAVFDDCTGCPFDLIELNSQAEVDAFGANFPTCTFTTSTLIIEGNDIVDLTPLSNLETIALSLIVRNNPQLSSLEGLNNISDLNEINISGNTLLTDVSALGNVSSVFRVTIGGNNALEAITGWENLQEITLSLTIGGNPVLTSLEGLQNVDLVNGAGLTIEQNASLENLIGLEGITGLGSLNISDNNSLIDISALSNAQGGMVSLVVSNNDALTNLDGLEGIDRIGLGTININNNALLENLDGLSGVLNNDITIPEVDININVNDALFDIDGLSNINPGSLDFVGIGNNPNLSECNIASFCTSILGGGSGFNFGFNAPGCNSIQEVESACIDGVIIPDFNLLNALLNYSPVIDTNNDGFIQFSEAEAVTGELILTNESIEDLTGIEAFINISELDVSNNPLLNLNLNNTNLEVLRANNVGITTPEIVSLVNLVTLELEGNGISSLDLSNHTALRNLQVRNNDFLALDLALLEELEMLDATNCLLKELELSNQTNLVELYLSNNTLASIDLSAASLLTTIELVGNFFSEIDFSSNSNIQFFRAGNFDLTFINAKNSNNTSITDFEVTNSPNLAFICVDDVNYAITNFVNVPLNVVFTEDCELSIQQSLLQAITLFPNPVSQIVTITLPDQIEFQQAIFFSSVGKILGEFEKTSIDVSNLSKGIYFIAIETNQGRILKKLIKE